MAADSSDSPAAPPTETVDRFDIRVFHRQVLGDGVLPLAVLEQKIDEWLEVELGPEVGSN